MRIAFQMPSDAAGWDLPIAVLRRLAETASANEYLVLPGAQMRGRPAEIASKLSQIEALHPAGRVHPIEAALLPQYLYQTGLNDIELQLGSPDVFHAWEPFAPMLLRRAGLVLTIDRLDWLDQPAAVDEQTRAAWSASLFTAAAYDGHFTCLSAELAGRLRREYPHLDGSRITILDGRDASALASALPGIYARLGQPEWRGRT